MHPFDGMDVTSGGQIISGGQIMAWMDLCAGIAAKRHCRQSVVTASFDELYFGVGATV
jgi:acyl-CoA hydrolase